MLKNPNYIYGPSNVYVPVKLNLGEYLIEKSLEHKNIAANINGITNESITFGEIGQQSMNLAISLSQLGVRKGHVVAICSENRPEFIPTVIATVSTGAVITPINVGYTKDELKHVMNISKPNYIFCSPFAYKNNEKTLRSLTFLKKIIVFGDERKNGTLLYNDLAIVNNKSAVTSSGTTTLSKNVTLEEFQAVDVEGQTDIAVILYSSGTTGLPKGVLITHYNLLSTIAMGKVDPGVITLLIAPWYHALGLATCLTGIYEGKTSVYLPRFDVNVFMETIEKYKITRITVVPPVLVAICKSPVKHDLSSVQYIHCGAAPLREDVSKQSLKKFPNAKILQGYGLSECTLAVSRDYDYDAAKIGAVGTVTAGCVVKVVDLDTRKPLGPHQQGEICVFGPIVMKGYIGKSKRDDFDDEGFFKTGDIGYYDEDKYLFIVDRLKELIKYKGYQVAPAEIEAVLLQHEAVRDAGVVGIPSASAGELPLAFVVTQPGAAVTEGQLQDFVAEKLSNPKHLRGGVRFVDAIPKNPSGKIMRRVLKRMAKTAKSKL